MVSKSWITFQIVLLLRKLLALRRWNILIEEYLGANGKLNVEKKDDISESTKYEDQFINQNTFRWLTRNGVALNSR